MDYTMFFALRRLLGIASLLLLICSSAHAFTPSPAQIEQFKRLPPAEQKALAASMGVNIDDVNSLINGSKTTKTSTTTQPISGPRNTVGDEAKQNTDEQNNTIKAMPSKQGLHAFGYDLFDLGADSFTPAEDIPIPAEYILGPGDTINIQLYGKESASHSLTISRDGTVEFPEIGPVALAGLKFQRVAEKIEEVVSQQMIGIQASVTMGPLRTIRIFILGDVNIPGSYVVGSLSTMTNAIFSSGGISATGSLRKIQLKRDGKTITTLDLYDLLQRGDTSNDSRLLPGDVIFVPPIGKTAGVDGAVKRPAIYELINEKNAADLLRLAGGLKADAHLASSKIKRQNKTGELTLSQVDLSQNRASKFTIYDGDTLLVGQNLNNLNDIIEASGHVKRETNYAWTSGTRFSDIIPNADSLLALPDLDIAIIEREIPGSREIEVLALSPQVAFQNKGSASDIELQARDHLYLFGFEQDRSELLTDLLNRIKLQASMSQREQTVRINGSVRFPGDYPLTKGMSARQLAMLAGGFTESALNRNAEITRYDVDENIERVVLHIEADLQNDNPILEAGDILRVQQIPLWKQKESVELLGEFRHPGIYTILPGETLTDVIRRAGGMTTQAYVEGAVFSRKELRELEAKRLSALKAEIASDIAASRLESSKITDDIAADDANAILANLDAAKPLGRLVIDLPNILSDPKNLDFELAEGDTIEIPRFKPSVTVVGEVQYPTSHFYYDKLNVDDYLNRSGGFKRNADKKRVYVIKANGTVVLPKGNGWFGGRSVALSPGDTIIVPIDTQRVDKLTLWSSVTTIMYQAALGVAAISAL